MHAHTHKFPSTYLIPGTSQDFGREDRDCTCNQATCELDVHANQRYI